jgi:hypothetical protein
MSSMRVGRNVILLIVPLAGAACGEGDPCGLGAMADTTGWRVMDAGPFVFKLPPGYRDEHALGTDSYAGLWTQGERSITFSYGPHTADPRRPEARPRGTLCEARIGGRTVQVSEAREHAAGPGLAYRVGGWWEKPDSLYANLYLGGTGPADDEAGRAIAATVLRTVRLRTVWSRADSVRFHHRICEISRAYGPPPDAVQPAAPDSLGCPNGPPPPPPDYEGVR